MKSLLKLSAFALLAGSAAPAFAQQVDPDRLVRPYWFDKPVVEGMGRAIMEVMPNRASFTVAFVETDGQSAEATRKAVQRARIAYDAIRRVAGNSARVTTSVGVTPYFEQYRDGEGQVQNNTRADRVRGYEARATMTVVLTDTALAGRARSAALALGPQDSGRINIYLEQNAEIQREVLRRASADARERATLMATASGGRLGDLLVLQEGSGPCMGNWSTQQVARVANSEGNYDAVVVTGSRMASPPPPPPPPPPAPAPVASGQVGGRTVTITEADLANLDLPSDPQPSTIQASICAIYTLVK
jgi:uncharacterized protein YggE